MKIAASLAIVMVLAIAALFGGPVGLAQDDPGMAPADDQGMPAAPCTPPADVPTDEVADPGAAPTCSPMPATELPPAPDTPAAVATDAPVAADTPIPIDTPVPAPTATVTPPPVVPTATPTPVPEVPTAAPTATSSGKDVPVGTLDRQLPFANPGEAVCEIDLTITGNHSCDPQTFPALFKIAFSPFSDGAVVTAAVDGGKPQKAGLDRLNRFDFLAVPGQAGAGTHTIGLLETAGGDAFAASVTVPVLPAKSPHFLIYPRVVRPGSSAKIYLAGFRPNTNLLLGVYREKADCNTFGQGNECFEFARELGSITTDNDGTATRDFSVAANEKPAVYLIFATGLKLDPLNAADSLKALGRPYFVVPGP